MKESSFIYPEIPQSKQVCWAIFSSDTFGWVDCIPLSDGTRLAPIYIKDIALCPDDSTLCLMTYLPLKRKGTVSFGEEVSDTVSLANLFSTGGLRDLIKLKASAEGFEFFSLCDLSKYEVAFPVFN